MMQEGSMATREIDIWKGDWGLPSVDLNCLQVMAYAKFSGAPIRLNKTNNPWRSPTGELPVFRQGSETTLTKFEDILRHLQQEKYNADYELKAKEHSDMKAYDQLLRDKLLPGLLYSWWVDSKNYIDLSRPWFAKALPFPLNYFIPGQRQRAAKSYLLGKYNLSEDEDSSQLEHLVLKNSRECLNLLSDRLETKDYMFGRSPTSLDALIFAYLAPLLKVPFPNPTLQNHLKGCDNLVAFVVRILRNYFPTSSADEAIKNTKSNENDAMDEFPNKRRNQFLAGFVAISAMIGYALTAGLVQVDISGDLDNEEELDEDEDPTFYQFNENDQRSD